MINMRSSLHATFVASVIVRGAGALLALAVNVALARMLGVKEYGYYMTVLSAALLLGALAVRGTNQLLTRELSRGAARKGVWLRHMKRWALERVAIGAATGVLVYLAWLILFESYGGFSANWDIYLAGSLLICMTAFSMLLAGALNGLGASLRSQCLGLVIQNAGMLVVIAVFWLAAGGLSGGGEEALWLQVAGYTLVLLVGGMWLRDRANGRLDIIGKVRAADDCRGTTAKDWSYAARNFLFITVAAMLVNRLDVVLLALLSNKENTGIYAAGARLAQVAMVVALAVNTVLSPRISQAWAENDSVALRKLLRNGLLFTFPIAFVEVVVAFIFSPAIMKMLGSGYSSAAAVFLWVVVAYASWTLSAPGYVFLTMAASERSVAFLSWLALIANVVAMIILVPRYGATGAGVSIAISYGSMLPVLIFLAVRKLGNL